MIRALHHQTRPQRTRHAEAVSSEARALGHEPRDWPAGRILLGAPAFLALLGLALGIVALAVRGLSPDRPTSAVASSVDMPAPRLEPHPLADRLAIERRQRERLRHAPIPIEAAMEEVARQGWREAAP